MSWQSVRTIHFQQKKSLIDPWKAQTILMQAMKGAGKSNFLEYAGEQLHNFGWTGLDLWGAPNGENWFYAINKDCRDEYLRLVAQDPIKKGILHCNCHKTHPIMILCPDTKKFDQYTVDMYNDVIIKSREWWINYCTRNNIFPIEWKKEMTGKKIEVSHTPLITIKYVPEPTHNGSNHEMFRKLMVESILKCRDESRFLTFNPMLWENEFAKYKAVEIIVKLLEYVKNTYFLPKPDEILDPIKNKFDTHKRPTFQDLKMYNWDKMFVLAREFGELTASNLRAEASSTITKRAFLGFIRRSRHAQITLLGDYQNPDDVFPSIRDQADIFLIKRAPKRLFGQGWEWFFKDIDFKRDGILQKHGHTKYGYDLANKMYPRIDQLANNYLYAVYPDDSYVLWKTPSPDFHHKKAEEHFRVITGITWESIIVKSSKSIEVDNLSDAPKEIRSAASVGLVELIASFVNPVTEGGKGMEYKEAFDNIMKMAETGKIPRPGWASPDSMSKWYRRNSKK